MVHDLPVPVAKDSSSSSATPQTHAKLISNSDRRLIGIPTVGDRIISTSLPQQNFLGYETELRVAARSP